MNMQMLSISGMTCDQCVKSIEEVLAGVAGVVEAKVSYDEGTAYVKTNDEVGGATLIDAVKGKGFGAEVLDRGGLVLARAVSDRSLISIVDTPSVTPRWRSPGGSPHRDHR